MSKSESTIQNEIRLALSKINGLTHWRNNTGRAWTGNDIKMVGRAVIIEDARPINFGLCPGSSDLIGFKTITITSDMVGQQIAQFTAIEIKSTRGKASTAQLNFNEHINSGGGAAIVARSVDDIEALK